MAASIRTTRVAAITAGGPTQDVTISGFGTPTAVVVRYVKAVTDDTVVGNAAMGAGLYDGTAPVCCFSHSITGGASASNGRGNDFSGSWFIRSFDSAGSDDARASVSFITDGVRLTWDLLPPAGWLMTFTFITGTDAEYCAHVDNAAGDVDVTAAGFQPNFILTIGANTGSFPSSSFDITEGYCVEDSGVVSQGSFSWWEQSGASNCSPMVVFDTAASKRVMFGGGLIGGIAWTDFDANGATAAQVNADGCDAIYLMLKFPAAQEVGIFSDSVTTSTGNTTIGPGGSVVPAYIEGCFAALTPAMDNTWRGSSGDPEAGVISLFSYDGTTQICNTLFLDESTDPVVTDSVSRSGSVFDSADDNQANAWVGTASAFTAGGMTVNITAAPATERRIFGWYLEEDSAGGTDDLALDSASTGSPFAGALVIGQVHALAFDDTATASPTADALSVGQIHDLTLTDAATASPAADSLALGQEHSLAFDGVSTGSPVADNLTLGQAHALTLDGADTGSPVADSLAIGQEHALGLTGASTGSPAADLLTLGQVHALTLSDAATDSPFADALELSESGQLNFVSASTGSPVADSLSLGQEHAIALSGASTGSPAADSLEIGQVHALAFDSAATASPFANALSVGVTVSLSLDDASTASPFSGALSIGQAHALTFDRAATGSPFAGSLSMAGSVELSFDDASTGSPDADSLSLTQVVALTLSDAATASPFAGAITIGQAHLLGLQGAATGSPVADALSLGQIHALTFDSAQTGSPFADALAPYVPLQTSPIDRISIQSVDTLGRFVSVDTTGAFTSVDTLGRFS